MGNLDLKTFKSNNIPFTAKTSYPFHYNCNVILLFELSTIQEWGIYRNKAIVHVLRILCFQISSSALLPWLPTTYIMYMERIKMKHKILTWSYLLIQSFFGPHVVWYVWNQSLNRSWHTDLDYGSYRLSNLQIELTAGVTGQ
jgi:hypothetical protein